MVSRLQKALLPAAALLLLPGASAQEILSRHDIFSAAGCGFDNNPAVLSTTIDVLEKATTDPVTGRVTTGCNTATIDLKEWPRDTSDRYRVWVDSANVEESCELVFYNLPEGDDSDPKTACFQAWQRITPKSNCRGFGLTQRFAYAYCCGEECRKIPAAAPGPTEKRRTTTTASRDVTAVKRAAPLQAREECRFERLEGDKARYTYGPQVKVGDQKTCPAGASGGCANWSWSYTAGKTVTTGTGTTVSLGVAWGVVTASLDVNMYEENSSSEEWTASDTLTADPGTEGYPAFIPRLICGKGKLVGDCDGAEAQDNGEYCVNVLVKGRPDGLANVVYVN